MSGQHNKDIIHLDCTLRDGGYYNNWEFDGYEQSELNEENNYIFSEFKNKFNRIIIKSSTPTKYNIDQSSLYNIDQSSLYFY